MRGEYTSKSVLVMLSRAAVARLMSCVIKSNYENETHSMSGIVGQCFARR